MYSNFISEAGISALKQHKYVSGKLTALDNKMTPFWNACVEYLPLWMAPNLVTLIGFVILLSSALLMIVTMNPVDFSVPGCVMVWGAFAGVIYQTLDAIDGKQARRLGKSSPLGQLFDHGCDAILTSFWLFIFLLSIGVTNSPLEFFIASIGGMALFFPPQLAEFFTHVLITSVGNFGITESELIMFAVQLTCGIFGNKIFTLTIPGLGISLRLLMMFAMIFTAIFYSIIIYKDAYKAAKVKLDFWKNLSPILFLIILTALLFTSSLNNHLVGLYFLVNFAFMSLTIKMIVCSLTKMNYPTFHPELLPPLALVVLTYFGSLGKMASFALYLGVSSNLVMLGFFVYGVVNQIAKALGIKVLTI